MQHQWMFCLLFLFIIILPIRAQISVKIGGIFSTIEEKNEFEEAVRQSNSKASNVQLIPISDVIHPNNSLHSTNKVCNVINGGVVAIIGPSSSSLSMHVKSISQTIGIPFISISNRYARGTSITFYPPIEHLSEGLVRFVDLMKWTYFSIVYDDDVSLAKNLIVEGHRRHWRVHMTNMRLSRELETLRGIKEAGEMNIILDVKSENIHRILATAQKLGMISSGYTFIITQYVEMPNDFRLGGAAIIFISGGTSFNLISNAVSHLHMAMQNATEDLFDGLPITCDSEKIWQNGIRLINVLKSSQKHSIGFNITHVGEKTDTVIAKWTKNEVEILPIIHRVFPWLREPIRLVITTVLNEPYTMLRESADNLEGNDRYEGFAIELIDEIAQILHFKYTIHLVKDRAYGVKNHRGEWNGMIGEVIRGEADVAIADLTITSKRQEAIDFTLPFLYSGISILFRKPTLFVAPSLKFLRPFSHVIWMYILFAFIFLSLLIFVVGRISPYEWYTRYPCKKHEHNDFSLTNSFWFLTQMLIHQEGWDVRPKSIATRFLSICWYFFGLIMVAAYTANLAAFLTVEKVVYPIESAEDLSLQTEIKYGCVATGSTRSFFSNSDIPTYARLWRGMSSDESNFVWSNREGRERVSRGGYAFFMESLSIDYIASRNCNLTQIGGLLDSKAYGLVVSKDSPFREPLNRAILRLKESGMIHTLYHKWWHEQRGGGACHQWDRYGSAVNELSMANLIDAFYVLIIGACIAFVIFLWEILQNWCNKVQEHTIRKRRDVIKDSSQPEAVEMLEKPSTSKSDERGNSQETQTGKKVSFMKED